MKRKKAEAVGADIRLYGKDILRSASMRENKNITQHGKVSLFHHSLRVAYWSLLLAERLNVSADKRALVRGALLHDYYLYDWHVKDSDHRFHEFTHARRAESFAHRDFSLTHKERDIIRKHMFPLNITPPKYKESLLVCVADKISAVQETLQKKKRRKKD